MSQFSWNNEWRLNELKEESFMVKNVMDKTPRWIRFVRRWVPKTLQKTLDGAFGKAFFAVFDKGAIIIEKTYNKKEEIKQFRFNKKKLEEETFTKKSVRRFERQCKNTIRKNLFISFLEGLGFGLMGMGIPDIPVMVSVLLKSIYEISLSYGFSYTAEKEKLFILHVIEAALDSGASLRERDAFLNDMIEIYVEDARHENMLSKDILDETKVKQQVEITAQALSKELLYWKFIEGKGVIGIVGGMSDIIYIKRITDYAILKYKRRFLLTHKTVV